MRPMAEPAFFAREGLLVEIYDASFPVEAEYSDFKKSPPKYAADQIWVARRG